MADLLSMLGFLAGALLLAAEVVLVLLVGYLLFLTAAAVVVWLTRPGERLGADGPLRQATGEAGRVAAPGRWPVPRTRFSRAGAGARRGTADPPRRWAASWRWIIRPNCTRCM